jgi:hypothetical protein
MLNPPRTLVVALALIGVAAFVLGLATDVGLFGWSLTVLLALYLVVAGMAQRTRRRTDTTRRAV